MSRAVIVTRHPASALSEAEELIALLEEEQQHGGPIRRRVLNEERLQLWAARDEARRGRRSEEELLDRVREARRVLAMYQ